MRQYSFNQIFITLAIIVLAFEPVLWLANTWFDPSYNSDGFIIFGLCVALVIYSALSPRYTCKPINKKYVFLLLALTTLTRLVSQIFAINIIGALALVIDVYAIAYLAGLHLRKKPLSSFWLAVCFAFCLPLENILQRTIGYGLQHISADGACAILGSIFDNVACSGVRILLNAQDVLVDLPCSGARCLLLLLMFYCMAAALSNSKPWQSALGLLIVLATSIVVNILRIIILAIGIAYPNSLGGIDVMAQPWHDIIGLITLAIGTLPILIWFNKFNNPPKPKHYLLDQIASGLPKAIANDGWWLGKKTSFTSYKYLGAIGFLLVAIVIINLPRKAIDVAAKNIDIHLPYELNGYIAAPAPLLKQEQTYFTQYGGNAVKASYGQHNLMVIRTSSPLRHLHAPDACLRGLGFKTQYQGITYNPIPTAIYKAIDTQGNEYRVAVSFYSANGYLTTNISEVVWRWLNGTDKVWSVAQRISPWHATNKQITDFDNAVIAAFDLAPAAEQQIQLTNLME